MPRRDDLLVGRWGARFHGREMPCSVGRGGITRAKREGDAATPSGVHRVTGMLYRPDRMAAASLPGWAAPFGPGDGWSDDVDDPDYNHLIRRPHPYGHERLARGDPLYDVIVLTDWNWPDVRPGAGSAIFIHTWRGPRVPTAGCVAFARTDLMWIMARLGPTTRLIVRG